MKHLNNEWNLLKANSWDNRTTSKTGAYSGLFIIKIFTHCSCVSNFESEEVSANLMVICKTSRKIEEVFSRIFKDDNL